MTGFETNLDAVPSDSKLSKYTLQSEYQYQ